MQPTRYRPNLAQTHPAALKSAALSSDLSGRTETPTGRARVSGAATGGGASAEGGALGLVSFKTTHTPNDKTYSQRGIDGSMLVLDPKVQRSARCRKSLLNTARLLTKSMQATKHRHKVAFLTLTYAKVEDYRPGHIALFMNHVRNWLKRRGIPMRGLRKLEMQKRGAVHYHLMLWLPKGITLPKPDKQGWWSHGSTNCQWLRNGYGYAAKYVSKTEQDMIPKGARLYSVFGLDDSMKIEVKWWITPKFVREAFPLAEGHLPIRAKGGGWISQTTGEIVYSEWQFGGIVYVSENGGPSVGWVRLMEADRRPKVSVDHAAGVKTLEELRFWESAANGLLYENDRMAWLSKMGMMGA